jgi:hypothetical protein
MLRRSPKAHRPLDEDRSGGGRRLRRGGRPYRRGRRR